jgi:hypothetical protein
MLKRAEERNKKLMLSREYCVKQMQVGDASCTPGRQDRA